MNPSSPTDLLLELLDWFEERSDADHNGVGYVPNDAMRFAFEIEQTLRAAGIDTTVPK